MYIQCSTCHISSIWAEAYTYLLEWPCVDVTVQVQTEKTVGSVCLFLRPGFGGSHSRLAAHEAKVTGSQITSTDPMNNSFKTVSQHCAQHWLICWYVVCRAVYTSPQCSFTRHSLQSWRSQGSDVPWAGRQEGRSEHMGIRAGLKVWFTSVLKVRGGKINKETTFRHKLPCWDHSKTDMRKERIFLVEFVISDAHSDQIDHSCPDAYWLLING